MAIHCITWACPWIKDKRNSILVQGCKSQSLIENFSKLIWRGESLLETDFELFLMSNFLSFKKSVFQILISLCMNARSESIFYSWNFGVGSDGQIMRKTWFNMQVPSLSVGIFGRSFWPCCWRLMVQACHRMVKEMVKDWSKQQIENTYWNTFSKEFEVGLLWSMKIVVSYTLNTTSKKVH